MRPGFSRMGCEESGEPVAAETPPDAPASGCDRDLATASRTSRAGDVACVCAYDVGAAGTDSE